jgi:hypothetical protein
LSSRIAADGVAHEMRAILGDFGPGEICQADNGKEFGKLVSLFEATACVHCLLRPRLKEWSMSFQCI